MTAGVRVVHDPVAGPEGGFLHIIESPRSGGRADGPMLVASIMLDAGGRISQWNAPAERLFGFRNDGIVGQHFSCLFADGDSDLLKTVLEAGYVDHFGDCSREDGSRFPAQALITPVKDGAGAAGFSLVVRDARGQSQRSQQEENVWLQGIIQSAMDAIITVGEDQRIVLFNAAAERIFRCPATDALGKPLDRFIPERFRAEHRSHIRRFAETGVTVRRMGGQTVLWGLRADGEEFPLEASISHVVARGTMLLTVILRDVTERQRAAEQLERVNRQLRELYAAMHEVREAERTRIARELHDELAQWLTALKMDVSWMTARIPQDMGPLVEKTRKMKGVIDMTVAAVRRIAADLRPVMLDDLGLLPAVEHLLHEFSERTGLVISLDHDPEEYGYKDPLVTAVYRMLQEALTNVARHAGASAVEVTLRREGDKLRLRVRDDGIGIQADAQNKPKSHGLIGIRERAQTLGGGAKIFSPAEGGTVVEVVIPLEAHRGGEELRA